MLPRNARALMLSGVLAAIGCSDPVPLAAGVGLQVNVRAGGTCSPGTQVDDIGMPPPDRFRKDDGRRVFDGEQGLRASCTVKNVGSGKFDVAANIQASNVSFALDGTVESDGFGKARIGLTSFASGTLQSDADCTITVVNSSEGLHIRDGEVWAAYSCSRMKQPPQVLCDVTGEFILEKCGS